MNIRSQQQQIVSQYTSEVIEELNKYINKINNPSFMRALSGTDVKRERSIQSIMNTMETHELYFLCNAISQALAVQDINSKFRDRVGKTAVSQLYKYIAGACELLFVANALGSAYDHSLTGTVSFSIACFATERFENYLQSVIKDKKLIEGVADGFDQILHTKLYDAATKSVKNLTLEKVAESSCNVGSNVFNFVQSNLLFLSRPLIKALIGSSTSEPVQHPRP